MTLRTLPLPLPLAHPAIASAPRRLVAALGIGVAVALATPVAAQDTAPPAAMAFSEDQIEAFVTVALEVAEIRDEYAMALDATDDADRQAELISEGNAAMLAAVDDAPQITVEEYIAIGEAAAADPELGQRIVMMMEERAAADG